MTAGRADRSFPRTYRLASSDDYRRVYRRARRGTVGPFAWYARDNDRRHPRLGLTVPKRVVKRATDRARVKRLIRESFRHYRSRLPSVDIVVSVKTLPLELRNGRLNKEIDHIWEEVSAHISDAP